VSKNLALLEEMLDLDEGVLEPEMVLEEVVGWDSIAKLSLIVLFEDEFSKVLTEKEIRGLVTVRDILDRMEG